MAQGKNSQVVVLNLFSLLPSLIKLVELFHAHAPGAEKKAAVIAAVGSVVAAGGGIAASNNPAYADIIGSAVDATVGYLNSTGAMPKTAAP